MENKYQCHMSETNLLFDLPYQHRKANIQRHWRELQFKILVSSCGRFLFFLPLHLLVIVTAIVKFRDVIK